MALFGSSDLQPNIGQHAALVEARASRDIRSASVPESHKWLNTNGGGGKSARDVSKRGVDRTQQQYQRL
jgi:hypothetical protein